MKIKLFLSVFVIVVFLACSEKGGENYDKGSVKPSSEMVFDKTKWQVKEGKDYPFREKMLNDVVYNDTIRSLNKTQILKLLGNPDRINENYFYYRVAQIRLIVWPLHTTTMVIKFKEDSGIEWIKIHR